MRPIGRLTRNWLVVAGGSLLAIPVLGCAPSRTPSTTPPVAELRSPPAPAANDLAGANRAASAPAVEVAAPFAPAGAASSAAPTPQVTVLHGLLSVHDARVYMVALINRDRRTMGLPPVELDEGAPTRAGQAHADDMAAHGFLGHWGTDGSIPEQRHTDAGGADMVLENVSCFVDEKRRTLDPAPKIEAEQVEKIEGMFWNEVPPHDGHRLNILRAQHRRVGIGIAQPVALRLEIAVPCFAQEFTDPYGSYAALPHDVKDKLHVEGTLEAPATFGGVGLARVDAPVAITASEANARRIYPVPPPYQSYWPLGFATPIPVSVHGTHFSIDVPVNDAGRPGLYEVSIWAKLPGSDALAMVGLRTLRAR